MNDPKGLLTSRRVSLVPELVTTMDAPGTTDPVASFTVPLMLPRLVCAARMEIKLTHTTR